MINCAMMCLLSATENSDENLHHSKQEYIKEGECPTAL